METTLTLGRMDSESIESLITGKSAASRAQVVARSESRLTESDRESLASGRWAQDVNRVSHGRLFYVDLPKAIAARASGRKRNGRGMSKDAAESLKTDAAMLLVEWTDARAARTVKGETRNDGALICKLGGSGNLPYKRDWLDPKGGEGVSLAAWDAMNLALNAAERGDSEYAARKREERDRSNWQAATVSVDELLADGMDGLTAAEKASLVNDIDTYGRAWKDRSAAVVEASAHEVAKLLGLSETAARYLESSLLHSGAQVAQPARKAYPGRAARVINGQVIEKARPPEPAKRAQPAKVGRLSKAACAHQWNVSISAVEKVMERGLTEIQRKYPDPSDLLSALRAASRALPEIREDAARESILEYSARPDDSRAAVYGPRNRRAYEADTAAREYLSATRAMPASERALYVALVKRVSPERAAILVDVIPRLIAAEYQREYENLRAGKRGILGGYKDSASDNPVYIGKRVWKTSLDDSETLATRKTIAARAAVQNARLSLIEYLQPKALAVCLIAWRESARQSAHDRQTQLAIEQSLDSAYSAHFHPTPNAYGRAHMSADARSMAELEKRMEVARKLRTERDREARIQRKRAATATAARKAS